MDGVKNGDKKMSLIETLIKILGIILIIAGIGMFLSIVGLSFFGTGISPWWLAMIIGFIFIAIGLALVRGGNISL